MIQNCDIRFSTTVIPFFLYTINHLQIFHDGKRAIMNVHGEYNKMDCFSDIHDCFTDLSANKKKKKKKG